MTTIKDDPNANSKPVAQGADLAEQVRTTVIDASLASPQWQPMNVDVADQKAAKTGGGKIKDVKTQGFHRQPDMPKLSSLAAIKVNYSLG